MNHDDIRHKLSEYIDGSITALEKTEIEEHLQTCETCKDALQELRKTIEHVKAIEEVEPPNWMAQKIMVNVRAAAEEKKGLFHRMFYPLAVKIPIQAVAVLFLTITVYYIYSSMHPAERYGEAPIERLAKQERPAAEKDDVKDRAPEVSVQQEKKVAQEPGYKSLDMKYSYEKPAPPAPAKPEEQPAAASTPAKREAFMFAKDEDSPGKHQPAPKAKAATPLQAGNAESFEQRAAARTGAPAMVAEQASGTVSPPGTDAGIPRKEDKDAEEILSVMEHFVRYDLPEGMKKKGLQYSARRVPEDLAGLQWLRNSTIYRSSACSRKYLVDVEFSGKSLKYLYCYDQDQPRLLANYELKAGTWVENK